MQCKNSQSKGVQISASNISSHLFSESLSAMHKPQTRCTKMAIPDDACTCSQSADDDSDSSFDSILDMSSHLRRRQRKYRERGRSGKTQKIRNAIVSIRSMCRTVASREQSCPQNREKRTSTFSDMVCRVMHAGVDVFQSSQSLSAVQRFLPLLEAGKAQPVSQCFTESEQKEMAKTEMTKIEMAKIDAHEQAEKQYNRVIIAAEVCENTCLCALRKWQCEVAEELTVQVRQTYMIEMCRLQKLQSSMASWHQMMVQWRQKLFRKMSLQDAQ